MVQTPFFLFILNKIQVIYDFGTDFKDHFDLISKKYTLDFGAEDSPLRAACNYLLHNCEQEQTLGVGRAVVY